MLFIISDIILIKHYQKSKYSRTLKNKTKQRQDKNKQIDKERKKIKKLFFKLSPPPKKKDKAKKKQKNIELINKYTKTKQKTSRQSN